MPTDLVSYALRGIAFHKRSSPVLLGALLMLSGCATYVRKPLPEHSDFRGTLSNLQQPVEPLKLPGKSANIVRPGNGLNADEAATLAVLNSPTLKAERAKLGVAQAQVFAAGLLPDPTLDLGSDRVTTQGPDLVNGWSASLAYPIEQLLTRSARHDAAGAEARKANLEVLWKEWQTAQQARLLVGQLQADARKLAVIEQLSPQLAERASRSAKALKSGDLPLDVAGADLVALVDLQDRQFSVERDRADAQSALCNLLGLRPGTTIILSNSTLPAVPEAAIIARARKALPRRRPDLLALQAGYASQEARVRKAILAQFPALGIGINRAKDTSAVYSTGFSLTLKLPLFSSNRGNIAVQRATREQLRAAYQARLDQADSDIVRIRDLLRRIKTHRQTLATRLPMLKQLSQRAREAYRSGELDASSYFTMTSGYLDKQLATIDLWQQDYRARVALQTLLGLPMTESGNRP